MSNAAVLERRVAIRLDGGTRWTIVGESDVVSSAAVDTSLSPEERLRRLKAKARRRAATRPMYNDSPENEVEAHASVMAAMPLQLRVVVNSED